VTLGERSWPNESSDEKWRRKVKNDVAIQSSTTGGLRELAFFAGAGGGILGGHLLGWRTVCAVERDAYCAAVLAQRQNDGILEPFPVWSDVETFDGKPWRGCVDVVSGGFPCTDISCAGKGAGIDGSESGLWREMARIVGEVRPQYVFVENSPLLVRRGLARVLGDLAEMGYDAKWCRVSAADVRAPHIRDRIWILASDTTKQHWTKQGQEAPVAGWIREDVPNSECQFVRNEPRRIFRKSRTDEAKSGDDGEKETWWPVEPDVGRVANGLANRVDRIRALGNGQVPRVAATAWRILNDFG
jgi:DNA (cytosine-5)-methyltransferase 1